MLRSTLLPAIIAFTASAIGSTHAADSPTAEAILQRVRPEHPRIFLTAADVAALRASHTHPEIQASVKAVTRKATDLLSAEPNAYVIPDGKRLLYTSRSVLDRTLTLGLAYHLTQDDRFAKRLWSELSTAAAFKDWNPSHFLDTAEMTAAFAIGYDWLYPQWSPEQRTVLRQAIVEKGLKPSLPNYRKNLWWVAVEHNWNQVCNGGMSLGALAIAEEEPALAGEILAGAIRSVPRAMKHFAPDGAWGEGPAYWAYATQYNVYMIAALESALGTDYGLSDAPGFDHAGSFPIATTGPLNLPFNYADAGEKAASGPQLMWMATKFSRPAYAAWRLKQTGTNVSPLDLVWGHRWIASKPAFEGIPTATYFRGAEVVTMRSAWNDANATFVGFKGGDNRVNHGHLDLGSFVLDAAGQRWGMDVGADFYNLPGYFGKKRWEYYRCRAEGQNTLVLNPGLQPDQDPTAKSPITRFRSAPERTIAITDLTAAYASSANRVHRGIALIGADVVVQDEVQLKAPGTAWWFMHTRASIDPSGSTAQLSQGGRTLTARILAPTGATFQVMPAEPLPSSPQLERQQVKGPGYGADKEGVRKLAVRMDNVTDFTLTVHFTTTPEHPTPKVEALAKW